MTRPHILGDLRIFQAIHNDLHLTHEEVTTADGRKVWAYTYDGVDPYELEDEKFPSLVSAALRAGAEQYVSDTFGPRCGSEDTDDFPDLKNDPKATRCACCEEWERFDEWVRQRGEVS